jgi:hypothetical protein
MLAHTFRGSSLKSMLGLENARTVFARYKAIRRAEREYLANEPAPTSRRDAPGGTPSPLRPSSSLPSASPSAPASMSP